jgi:hypothetical protein
MTLARSLVLAALGAAAADQVCSNMDAGCAAAETEDMGMLQKVSMMARIEKHEFQKNVSGPIPECQNLSTNASNASKCPTGTIVNSGLWCISNPSCPGITGCVEGTGCQYVPAPAPALLQQSGPIPECQNLSTNASNASKCPTGTIVNSGLWCISNPSCPGTTGCVEGTGCQYVPAPAPALLQQSGPIPECQNLSTNASNASKCPTGTIVNPSLYCISNPSCPGSTGCVEGTGCQYVDAPNTSLLEKM